LLTIGYSDKQTKLEELNEFLHKNQLLSLDSVQLASDTITDETSEPTLEEVVERKVAEHLEGLEENAIKEAKEDTLPEVSPLDSLVPDTSALPENELIDQVETINEQEAQM